jgi:spore maturation protein CgeB
LEFGANPLVYCPVPAVTRDLNYVFLGSCHFEKLDRYWAYLKNVFAGWPGFIAGPGWKYARYIQLPEEFHRYLYARAKVGLNLHVPFQIDAPSELNERAYNLAAAGVPQLMDFPKLLPQRLGENSVYAARSPQEYLQMFHRILANPEEALDRASMAMEQVLSRHTVFHRAEAFIDELSHAVLGR